MTEWKWENKTVAVKLEKPGPQWILFAHIVRVYEFRWEDDGEAGVKAVVVLTNGEEITVEDSTADDLLRSWEILEREDSDDE